jgi:uncharacterized protein YfaS (alpha-2-macroglobulin family)
MHSKPYLIFSLKYLVFCIALLCTLLSCSNRNALKVSDKNFDDEVAQQQNLIFKFNKALYPDSLLNRWDTTTYIDFEPKVAGAFRWNNAKELVFSPAAGFKPGVAYKAKLSPQLVSKADKPYTISDDAEISFRTAPLKIMTSHTQYVKGASAANVMLQMDITFNYDANITEAASLLKLQTQGRPVSFNAVSSGVGKTLSVQFLPLNDYATSIEVAATLAKGVGIAGGNVKSANDTSFTTTVVSRKNLAITNVQPTHDGSAGSIRLSLSQPIVEEDLKQGITISPSIPFDVKLANDDIIITSTSFDPKKQYTVKIAPTVKGVFGGSLPQAQTETVQFATLEPAVNFINSKGMYLSSKGYKNVALNIVNVPKVVVTVVKVYENNMMQLFRNGNQYSYAYDNEDEYHDYSYYNTINLGDTVFTQTYEVSQLPKSNAAHLLHLDFEDKLKGYNGVYVINVASTDQQWVQESKILSLSDIGLIVKEEDNRILVFANSIRYASPLKNVKITFVSSTNQPFYTTETDKNGVAVLEDIKSKSSSFKVGMVTAKNGEEYGFIGLNQSRIETSRFDIGGRVVSPTGLNAWIYAERNLYRPGETIHASAIIRTESWTSPASMPVKMRLLTPNGKEFSAKRLTINEQGSVETAFPIPSTALTGTYTLQLFSGNDVLLAQYYFSIEDFMPDRIKSDLKLNKESFQLGERIATTIQADNLFGTPAAHRNYEWEWNMTKVNFEPKGFEEYNFKVEKNFDFKTVFREGKTSESGGVSQEMTADNSLKDLGLLRGHVRATVFDETGRPVHRYAKFDVYTQPVFIGIKNFDYYVSTRRPISVNLVALNAQGGAVSQAATATLLRREWQNVMQEKGGKYKYVSQWVTKTVSTQAVQISGNQTTINFTPEISGQYEVRVNINGSSSFVANSFYAYGFGDTQYSSFEVNNEGNVSIKTDKENYGVGDKINVLFTTPFEGRMLVTIERDQVIEYTFLETHNRSASLTLNTKDTWLPNVYISATLIRPMDDNDLPLTVAHGFKNIKVENSKNKLPISVQVIDQSRSKTKQTIKVKTEPNAYVTIAAVDEGILQVKNYKTPDPYQYFYQKVALAVGSYNVYPWLLPEYKATQSSTGGDGGDDDQNGRVNPLFVNRVKNVSFWSGILKADGAGNVQYDIDIPQFSGAIRIMAVAYKNNGFGSWDNLMKVADPIVLSTALPRFLSPKDQVLMPVIMSNTTDKNTEAAVKVRVEGPLGIQESTKSVSIKAKGEGRAVFAVQALPQIGVGKVTVSVQALGETFTDETELSIRPPASLQKKFESGVVRPEVLTTLNLDNNFLPGTVSGYITVSKSPLTQFAKNLDYLVRYPYGCVEQTVASAFPQLYYNDLVQLIKTETQTDQNPNYNVQQAIYKLQAMQLPNGALSYWPGGNYESWWGSVFAAHFLVEAQKAGFEVNTAVLNKLVQYVKFRLNKKEVIEYYYNNNQRKSIAAKEIPYSLYVLALIQQPQWSTMNYYKANLNSLSLDGKYLLAAAYALGGKADQGKQILPKAFAGEQANNTFGGSFYSYVRDKALTLNALLEIDPQNAQVPELAKQLSEEMNTNPYLNTQESVFSLLALGKIAKTSNQAAATALITANGKKITETTGAPVRLNVKDYLQQALGIKVSGKGNYYYFKELNGISADGKVVEEDKYMQVRRSYYDRTGKFIANNTFKQNDLIVVKITIIGQYNGTIENVVITDMLPAGLEIENTRLNQMPNLKWVTERKDQVDPDYMDIRDDRLNIFTSVTSSSRTFYYMVRAVSPGTYQLGPVQADAMYNGMFHSYHGAGVVKVLE